MRYQIDEKNKKITFECEILVLVELAKYMDKLLPVYPDVKTWSIASQVSFSQAEPVVELFNEEAPEKPEDPGFDFNENTLPKKKLL